MLIIAQPQLLIDAYGTIEPVEAEAMEGVFKSIEADRHVQLQGGHWAALINAWGCVKKDLDKAITVFDSIAAHPSSSRSGTPMPDAVAFEALFNVLITHHRTDLLPRYIERLKSSHVHMTAYIANFLIKGYATVGDLEQARAIFEGLADPPEGVAAPNNHVPHESLPSPTISATAPVYREVGLFSFTRVRGSPELYSRRLGKRWFAQNLVTAIAIVQ